MERGIITTTIVAVTTTTIASEKGIFSTNLYRWGERQSFDFLTILARWPFARMGKIIFEIWVQIHILRVMEGHKTLHDNAKMFGNVGYETLSKK